MTFGFLQHHALFSSFEHHWADFSAEGRSKLSEEGLSQQFQHDADATGINASVGYRFISDDSWGLSLSADYKKWTTDGGKETLLLEDGSSVQTRLNRVESESVGLNLGINFSF